VERLNAHRWWAASGAVAVLLFALGLVFGDLVGSASYPRLDAPAVRAQAYLLQNSSEVRALAFFHALAAGAMLTFITYVQMWLRRLDQRSARLAPVTLAGGGAAASFLLLSAISYRVLAEPAVARDPALTHGLLVFSYLTGGPGITLPLALPIAAGSLTSFRRELLPAWVGWLGSAAAIACVASSGIFLGSMNNNSVWYGVLLVAAVLSLVWMFGTSLLLTRRT
jgi:hypothetical protein